MRGEEYKTERDGERGAWKNAVARGDAFDADAADAADAADQGGRARERRGTSAATLTLVLPRVLCRRPVDTSTHTNVAVAVAVVVVVVVVVIIDASASDDRRRPRPRPRRRRRRRHRRRRGRVSLGRRIIRRGGERWRISILVQAAERRWRGRHVS